MKKEKLSFDEYYHLMYGERWEALKAALMEEPKYTTLDKGLTQSYFLDEASYIAAATLGVEENDTVLDMCAAPGGKTLVLALALGKTGTLVANDRSRDRRSRLRKVLEEHLPRILYERIQITGHDAAKWGLYEQNRYSRILLDAPCSSERHVLRSSKHLEQWSESRSKRLAIQAYAMLCAAITAAAPGGFVLYSTCTVSKKENEGVIQRALSKFGSSIVPSELNFEIGEPANPGWYMLPDETSGMGPIYMAKIKKTFF